jgi:glycine cleavage system H protein
LISVEEIEPLTYKEFGAGDMNFRVPASGYYFNNTDCWARIDGTVARVGISDFIRLDPREIVSLEPPDVGLKVSIFDGLCSFATDNVSLDVNSPVSGTVVSVNQNLIDNPWLVKEDPYERGWVVEVELSDIDDDIEFLTDCEEYFYNAKVRVESGPRVGCPCSRRGRVNRPGNTQDEG